MLAQSLCGYKWLYAPLLHLCAAMECVCKVCTAPGTPPPGTLQYSTQKLVIRVVTLIIKPRTNWQLKHTPRAQI